MSPQDIIKGQTDTKQCSEGGYVEFILPRAAEISIANLLIDLQVNQVVTTAGAIGDAAFSRASWIDRLEILQGTEVTQRWTGRGLAYGNPGRNTIFSFLPTPQTAVSAGALASAQYMLDFLTTDGINPKDTALYTSAYAQTSVRVYLARWADMVVGGVGAQTAAITVGYTYFREYDVNRAMPDLYRTSYNQTQISLAAASGGSGLPIRLTQTGEGVLFRSAFIECYNAATKSYISTTVTNLMLGANQDRHHDLPARMVTAYQNYDYEILMNAGHYALDICRIGESQVRLSNTWNLEGVSDPYLWVQNIASPNVVIDVHFTGYRYTASGLAKHRALKVGK
jgi:hypothetical protein